MATPDINGCIADSTTVDTASTNPTATYPLQSHGGSDTTCTSIFIGGAKVQHIDITSKPTDVSGVPIQPLVPPVPQPLTRLPPITGIVNSVARGVYFEGILVPVVGDAIKAPGAAPDPRVLTTGGTYPTIFIGTTT